MKGVIIIPARLQSTRLPGKLLLDRTGKPLVRHVFENCQNAADRSEGLLDGPFLAASEWELMDAVQDWGRIVTRADHPNGTSRCAEVASYLERKGQFYDFVINVQADEPELLPEAILALATDWPQDFDLTTLAVREHGGWRFEDPNTVKVVVDRFAQAIYFSRSPIPYGGQESWLRHIGAYRYTARFLREHKHEPAKHENLEQLNFMRAGYTVNVRLADASVAGHAINTPEDYDRFVTRYLEQQCHSQA